MSFYSTLKKIRLGKLCQISAGIIDDFYLQSTTSFFSRAMQFIKTRTLATFLFIPSIAIDVITSTSAAIFYKISGARYQRKANYFYELAKKNLLGLLVSPIGIFFPKLVSFYFIPRRKNVSTVLSGGHLHAIQTQMQYPKNQEDLQNLVALAYQENKTITVVGAGASQGKQFLPKENNANHIIINMRHLNQIDIHPEKKTVTVGAGATWAQIQLAANSHCLALKVMQASNVFSVGGSISTNIHGWNKAGTLAETIRSLTIINAQGKIQLLKPSDALFQYVVGGFNQFGIILSAEIALTDNELLTEHAKVVDLNTYVDYFKNEVQHHTQTRMHLYRLSLDPANPLGEGIAVNYQSPEKPIIKSAENLHQEPKHGTRFQRIGLNLTRRIAWLRKYYWLSEKNTMLNYPITQTTNEIMQPPIKAMFNHSLSESEWLQEYFIPGENLADFLKSLGAILKTNHVALLNATVRYVKQDNITKMGYANDGDRFAVVLCFNQHLNKEAVLQTKKWIREATELSLTHGGTYYLPYQDIPSSEQFLKGYPTAKAVYLKKLEIDPKITFNSGFAQQYFAPLLNQATTNPYKNLLSTPENKATFGQFLDNILDRVDKNKLYPLLEDILSYSDTPEEIYRALSQRISEVMPNPIGSAMRISRALTNIKHDLSEQALSLMKNHHQAIHGLVEIGYPGRFVKSMKQKLNISGPVTVIHEAQSWTDLIQSGIPRGHDRFVPLNDYDPLSTEKFADCSVDMITCFTGLHHIPENKIARFLQSLNRILRPGGSFLLVDHDITDPQTHIYATLAHSIYNAVMGTSVEEEMQEIRNFQSLDEWKNLLSQYGFDLQMEENQPGLVRTGDPSKNTMLRFVKKIACNLHVDMPNIQIEDTQPHRTLPNTLLSAYKNTTAKNDNRLLHPVKDAKQYSESYPTYK